MTRKRTPEAVIGADDYLIVKHTHDIEIAQAIMAGRERRRERI